MATQPTDRDLRKTGSRFLSSRALILRRSVATTFCLGSRSRSRINEPVIVRPVKLAWPFLLRFIQL
jgi:hypothetical protein